jgi:hypothetical protein
MTPSLVWICLLSGAVFFFTSIGAAQDESAADSSSRPPDKSKYSLFNPTPKDLLRELTTDRPDQTESPYTVDAGHFQVEMDFFTYTRDCDRSNGMDLRQDNWSVAPINLKVGLLNSVDLQLLLDTYLDLASKDRIGRTSETNSGFGDVLTRLKINFWGNDGGPTAFGMMPFLKWPLPESGLRNGRTEGGVIFPVAVQLPMGWDMGAMTEFDYNRDGDGNGHHAEFINSITFGHTVFGKLRGYCEFFSNVSNERETDWVGAFDVGLSYLVTGNVQLDGGCNFGVTNAAEDFKAFSGISLRF